MKKRLITILSLILAFVLCFALVACGGDNTTNPSKKPNDDDKKPGGDKDPKPEPSVPSVSITLNQALDAIDDVLSVQGFTGTASYALSTKNTQPLNGNVTLDKRGNKLKIAAGSEEHIVDMATGYVYSKGANGYTYVHEFYANIVDYVQYVISNIDDEVGAKGIKAVYDEDANTLTFVVEKSESVNKYLDPLQKAYKNKKDIGALLDDYCKLLFGKSFNAIYKESKKYISNSKNTVGTVLDALKDKGLDVEAILEMTGYGLPADQMKVIKARPLNKFVAGAYTYLMSSFGDMLPMSDDIDYDDDDDDDYSSAVGGGMQEFAFGLLNAALFEDVTEKQIEEAVQGIDVLLTFAKEFNVRTAVDLALENVEKAADLYTVIKDGVQLKNATITVTLTINEDKTIKGVKVDCLAAHTYDGKAADGSFLADNDYHATAELTIDEYKTSTEDFVINFAPDYFCRASIISLLYEVTDKNVSVYLESGDKTANVTVTQGLAVETLDGEVVMLKNVPNDAFKFDAKTSSFVFDGAVVKSALENVEFGTTLFALVYFEDDEDDLYAIGLSYVNDDWQDIFAYLYDTAMESALEFIGGGHDMSRPPEDSNMQVA